MEVDMQVEDMQVEVTVKALLNREILHKIFHSLDITTLKVVRHVCKVWDAVGATYLGRLGHINFSEPPNCGKHEELAPFDHKLAKNITLEFYGDQSSPKLPTNFFKILPHIDNKLESLEFHGIKAFKPLQEIWSNYAFPRLTNISIVANGPQLDKEPPPLEIARFGRLPTLKMCSVKISPYCRNPLAKGLMTTICQNLANSAPDLEEVYLDENIYLSLTACEKLKILSASSSRDLQYEVSEMEDMLESCQNSLQSFTLGKFTWNEDPRQLNLPLPSLTHLKLHATHIEIIKDLLNVTNLPELTHFSISFINLTSVYKISELLQNHNVRHAGITSLDFIGSPLPQDYDEH
ncbi:uncharacterized protein LOC118438141 [Folsomia candida]|uniref:uncharacterized protein LOC118438141 n=1 Tax=Folsomia candida TaxID=158441 RepID=UPI001604E6E0|nr:uncharacterized protein LOC118438141 [Folsomia candida]